MANFDNREDAIINKVATDDGFCRLFDRMIKEVLEEKRYDTLVSFVDLYVMGVIRYWCSSEPYFNHPDHVDEVAQLVRIKLMKKTVYGFIYVNGIDNGINNDPDGFRRWMFTLAKNVAKDYFKKERRLFMRQDELPDTEWNVEHTDTLFEGVQENASAVTDVEGEGVSMIEDLFVPDEVETARKEINDAFRIVMEGNSNVYIILTWVASYLYMQVYYKSKIEASRYVREFGKYTLNELYEVVLNLSENVPWLVIDDDMKENIESKLDAPSDIDETRTYGECRFEEFYGENPTARVSDWINKRNQRIIKLLRKKKDNSDNENGDDKH